MCSDLATLHMFFLATATLAHRSKSIKILPSPTAARLRQQLSAIQIIRYMQEPERLQSLHPLPIAIYATSLALSVSYQHLRYSRLPSDQEDAHKDFNAACSILQSLRVNWAAADAMASLAQKISVELKKMPSLDLLRIRRLEHGEPARGSITRDSNEDIIAEDVSFLSRQAGWLRGSDNLEGFDLFGGMDDISWMYLNAENSVSFESLPMLDFDSQ